MKTLDGLFRPRASVTELADQRTARLAARVAAALAVATALALPLTWFSTVAPARTQIGVPLAFAALAYATSFELARTRAFRGAIVVMVATQIAAMMSLTLAGGRSDGLTVLIMAVWMAPAVLTTGMFASLPWILCTGAAAVAVLLLVFGFAQPAPPSHQIHGVMILAMTTILTTLTRWHHDALEAIRRQELTQRNTELEALRHSLEDRVAERTRDVRESHEELSRALDSLRANQLALVTSEKLAAVGRLTAGIAHEMSSPLAAVSSAAAELKALVEEYERSIGDADVTAEDHLEIAREMREALDLVTLGAERSATYVRGIKAQTRAAGPQKSEHFDAVALANDVARLLAHAARSARCRLQVASAEPSVTVMGPPGRLAQAITNLLQNAIDATGERGGGEIVVEIAREAHGVQIGVRDAGPGIPDEILGRIFEPMFTTKPFGRGTGLGLAIVKEAVEGDFAGRIAVETRPGTGSRFVLHLPDRRGSSHAA